MGNLQSSAAAASSLPAKSRNKRPSAAGTRDWLLGGASRVLRKPVAPAAADVEAEAAAVVAAAAAAAAGHVTVTSRDLRRQHTPPARNGDDTDHHADEQQQQQHRQEHRGHYHRRRRQDESASSTSEEEDSSSVFADTLTSPQSVYSDARDEPDGDDDDDDDGTATIIMVVNGGETLGGSTGRTAAARQAFTIVKHRKVELNPTKIQSVVSNGKSISSRNIRAYTIYIYICGFIGCSRYNIYMHLNIFKYSITKNKY